MMARSRGGCLNCKRRKRKCDETRPGCQACEKRGIICEGYATPLRWANGIASRGRFAGASAPEPLVGGASKAPADDGDSAGQSSPNSTSTPGHAGSVAARSDLSPTSTSTVSDTQEQVFKKFLHSGLHRLYTTEQHCWIQPFFEEMGRQSPALVVISVAIQGYLDDRARGLSVASMERVDLALQTFRQELYDRHEKMHTATVCAGLLVCTICLFQAHPWTMYIDLMVNVYELRHKLTVPGLIPIEDLGTRHVLEVMGIMDLPSMAIGRSGQSVGVWKLLRKLQDTRKEGRVDGIEVATGMPMSLLDIFASILDNDVEYTENRLWTWPGQLGEYLQTHLWDCWRFSAILEVRRRYRLERKQKGVEVNNDQGSAAVPNTELILCRLMSSMDALHRAFELPQNQHLLVHNGLMYPLVTVSLEVPLLQDHPDWKHTLDSVRATFQERDTFNLINVIFDLLDEAWKTGTSTFDIEEAARQRGVEIALF
ncbi:Zn(2)-C6 fungal-type domain-containing protein [Fusarium sp. LHS14.1]|nr:Zn(2)-C6 fungal-type domain-containing protein [Fusarium sp. LHS14.1]